MFFILSFNNLFQPFRYNLSLIFKIVSRKCLLNYLLLYRKRDSNSQNSDSKSDAFTISPFLLYNCWFVRTRTWTKRVKVSYANQLHHKSIFVEIVGFEPTQLKQQIYSLPQLSNFGVLPFCLGNRTWTCNLLHPKQVNNQSLSSQFCGLYGNRTRFSRETVRKVSQ